ncbi:MAG TPA: DUF2807 domain-containing protein [Flavobacterium sp.]|jgi:hypothetical protein
MKTYTLVLFAFFTTLTLSAQKVKGSKIVTLAQREIGNFDSLEISDNLEIFLVPGTQAALEIEADDNLHDLIAIELSAGTLRLSAKQEVTSSKKFSVKITYTSDLKMVIAKENSVVTALADMALDNLTLKALQSSKFYATVKSKKFTLMADDRSKCEFNITSAEATVELSKNSSMKALISAENLIFDMYQKSLANIEGDISDLKLRLDNNANFTGRNLTSKNAEIITEGYSNGSIMVTTAATITATGKSELELHGDPKIDLIKFTDNAVLRKKPSTRIALK